jgi:hypothetical protein
MESAYLPNNKWKKMWHTYTMEIYTAIRRTRLYHLLEKWMELESIMLSEINQSNKDKNTSFFFFTEARGKQNNQPRS